MQDLEQTAKIFGKCVGLHFAAREALLHSIDDPGVVRLLRSLLQADAAAEREGFLTRLPH